MTTNKKTELPKFPKLRRVYGSPSIHANRDLNELIEDYNKIERWRGEMKQQLKDIILKTPEPCMDCLISDQVCCDLLKQWQQTRNDVLRKVLGALEQ